MNMKYSGWLTGTDPFLYHLQQKIIYSSHKEYVYYTKLTIGLK